VSFSFALFCRYLEQKSVCLSSIATPFSSAIDSKKKKKNRTKTHRRNKKQNLGLEFYFFTTIRDSKEMNLTSFAFENDLLIFCGASSV